MDKTKRKRNAYVTQKQKKKLIFLMRKHPGLMAGCRGNTSQGFNPQQLWIQIANECNAIPGAKKTWRLWRKTWHDLKSKAKKKHKLSDAITSHLMATDQDSLEPKFVSSTTNNHSTEFVSSGEAIDENLMNEDTSEPLSETDDEAKPIKVATRRKQKKVCIPNCMLNCEKLAAQEQKKVLIKQDYFKFKKDYLKQKLLILQEQTEALKSIAKVLAK